MCAYRVCAPKNNQDKTGRILKREVKDEENIQQADRKSGHSLLSYDIFDIIRVDPDLPFDLARILLF